MNEKTLRLGEQVLPGLEPSALEVKAAVRVDLLHIVMGVGELNGYVDVWPEAFGEKEREVLAEVAVKVSNLSTHLSTKIS